MEQKQAREGRRRFLVTVAIVGSGLAAASRLVARSELAAEDGMLVGAQDAPRRGMPSPPPPAEPQADDKTQQGLDPQAVRKAQLRQSEKEFREGVDRLYGLAGELKNEVAQAPPSGVLSARMYKKMEEIEKLAKRLKSEAKG